MSGWHLKKKIGGILAIFNNMDELGSTILSEISQTQQDKYWVISLLCEILKS